MRYVFIERPLISFDFISPTSQKRAQNLTEMDQKCKIGSFVKYDNRGALKLQQVMDKAKI